MALLALFTERQKTCPFQRISLTEAIWCRGYIERGQNGVERWSVGVLDRVGLDSLVPATKHSKVGLI